ncbi:MAG: histidine kinase [Oscillatoria sp. SIO1A7]|nr:histidine kinase [Oscillatoria sp. SIO1A7]
MADDKILYYFIEEAKEHLDTLEKGLLDLQTTASDQESVNELFRAAHSVKGGAAMLGFGSIQKTAHRLEDSFKVLKENKVAVDEKLESLFLKSLDILQDLLQRLQSPSGLDDKEGEKVVKGAEPVFEELQNYLNRLLSGEGGEGASGLPAEFGSNAIEKLRELLQLFKQKDNASVRKKMRGICKQLQELAPDIETWQAIVATVSEAIANTNHSYATLAPVVIKELKQATDWLLLGQAEDVAPSEALQSLARSAAGQKYIAIPVEPKAAAKIITEAFDKKELTVLVKLLAKAVKSAS